MFVGAHVCSFASRESPRPDRARTGCALAPRDVRDGNDDRDDEIAQDRRERRPGRHAAGGGDRQGDGRTPEAVDKASTVRLSGSGPPSAWPTARPAIARPAIANTPWPAPNSAQTSGQTDTSTGNALATNRPIPKSDSGRASFPAQAGRHRCSAIPTARGSRTVISTVLATVSGVIASARPNALAAKEAVTGTVTIASRATVIDRPTA